MDELKYETRSIIDYANKLDSQLNTLQVQLDQARSPFGKLQPYKEIQNINPSAECSDSQFEQYKLVYEQNLKTAEENEVILNTNRELLGRVVSVVSAIGIPAKISKRKSGRNGNWTTVTADWVDDLNALLPSTAIKKVHIQDTWNSFIRRRDQIKNAAGELQKAQERAREIEAAKTKRVVVVTKIAIQLGLEPENYNVSNLEDVLRAKDKYLDLSIAMSNTRGDWSDGPWEVSEALSRFHSVGDGNDFAIAKDVSGYLEDFEDGRVFRDCEWNYGRLLELVNPEIKQMWAELVAVREN